jgi:hypothetical protein
MTLVRRLIAWRLYIPSRRLSASALPSHSRGPVHPPLLNETIGKAFRRIVLHAPSAAAVSSVHQRLHMTYQQLSDAVDNAARALISAGVKRGDRVGILSPNKSVTCDDRIQFAILPHMSACQCGVAHRSAVYRCCWRNSREHQPCVIQQQFLENATNIELSHAQIFPVQVSLE